MNKKPRKVGTQQLGFYAGVDGGGYMDIGVLQLSPGVALYHEHSIAEMIIAERVAFVPYMLSVLAVLGHNQEK